MDLNSIMSRTVITAPPNASMITLCKLMNANYIGSVVIISKEKPVGIVTERDVVKVVAENADAIQQLTAEELMQQPIQTLKPKTSIQEAAEFMKNNRIRRVPVMEKRRMIGIVTYGDILKYMKRALIDSTIEVKELRNEVERDGLTGVFSRKYFNNVLAREVQRIKTHGGFLSLLMVDIDHFKEINDTHGHEAGDMVLMQIAGMIRLHVREINAVCRYGGDEFAIIAPISDMRGALRMGERLRAVIESMPILYQNQEIHTSLSVGTATWTSSMQNAAGLMRAADQQLYKAKQAGRNCVMGE